MPLLNESLEERLGRGRGKSIPEMIDALAPYGGLAAEVVEGAETFKMMVEDKDLTLFFTISGAMTIAKMGLVICDMLDHEMVDYVASTGALMAHGLVESIGLKHYKHDPKYDDGVLAERKLNRVTDTLEPEENLDAVADVIREVLGKCRSDRPLSPSILNRKIGQYLKEKFPRGRGILKSAYNHNIPVVVPAFVDSELGNDVYTTNLIRQIQGKKKLMMDLEIDSALLIKMMVESKKAGIFTVGGGVPRNNTQNVAPLLEIRNARLEEYGVAPLREPQFLCGAKICPDKNHFGHLGGCSYDENKSWRKMALDGRFSEMHGDATYIFPILVKYALARSEGRRVKFSKAGKLKKAA
jgi:deoxyhypusine synthase